MLQPFDLYRRLIKTQIQAQTQYRLSFLLDIAASALNTIFNFGMIVLIFQRFESIGGWTIGEVAFLLGTAEISFGIMDIIFSGFDPPYFGEHIRRGTFDQLLLRPVNITIQVLTSRFDMKRIGKVIQGFFILLIAFSLVKIDWTIIKIIYIPIVIISMVAFFGGLFVIGATFTFWTVESIEVMNIFTYGGSEMISYPMHIYNDWIRRFFTYFLPAIFINYAPALYLLGKSDPLNLPKYAPFIAPLVGFAVLWLALKFWGYGIRHYQSTGS